ncbi:MAG: NAD-dependent epimerase/dehydratase family protein [Planctomycetota bacterium]|nr:MAG: NAD-dependent epimerase/dehydratase family protein [Planctomycetota bacterium]
MADGPNFDGKKVLVTGAGGFVGSHLAEALVECGAETRALFHYNSMGRCGWLDFSDTKSELQIIHGDICDPDCMLKAADGVDIVFHLAALIGIPYSYHAPISYIRTNIEGTLNVMQAALSAGVGRLIHTSTSETYGTAEYIPIDEKHPLKGQSPYSASKIGADKLAESFYRSFGLNVVTVRPFNTYGPRQSARAIIPTIITQCRNGKIVKLGNLEPTRDFTFVDDTVSGFLCAAKADHAVGEVINLGSGKEISIKELAELISSIMCKKVEIISEGERTRPDKSEVDRLCASNDKAKKILSWEPCTSFEDGLKKTIKWFESNISLYDPGKYMV